MDLYQMFCDRIDNDSGYDNAKLAKDLIAMIPDTVLNKVASLQPIISESECDYRKSDCTNEGKVIDGKWVCSNHERTAVCEHPFRYIIMIPTHPIKCGLCKKKILNIAD